MPVGPDSQMPTPGNGSDPRIIECANDRAHFNQGPSSPYQTRNESAKTQRKASAHEDDNPTRRPWSHNHRKSHSLIDISSDSDSSISSSVLEQSGLKIPYNFKRAIIEENVPAAAGPSVVRQSDHRKAKEHRHQLYHESIQTFIHSRYAGEIYERGDPTIDLFTKSARENKGDDPPELMTWM